MANRSIPKQVPLEEALQLAAVDIAGEFKKRTIKKPISVYNHNGSGEQFTELLDGAFANANYVPTITLDEDHVPGSYGVDLTSFLKHKGYDASTQ